MESLFASLNCILSSPRQVRLFKYCNIAGIENYGHVYYFETQQESDSNAEMEKVTRRCIFVLLFCLLLV